MLQITGCAGNNGGTSASTLCDPDGLAVDSSNNLYVVDISNNRALEYNASFSSGFSAGQPANLVFGQAGSFTANQCNLGAGGGFPSAQTLGGPDGIALDALGNLYTPIQVTLACLSSTPPQCKQRRAWSGRRHRRYGLWPVRQFHFERLQ